MKQIKYIFLVQCLKPTLILILLFSLSYFLYRQGLVALPRADHTFILSERGFYSSEWEFFKSMVSFSRTRHVSPGDAYLFRPGTHALLAITDIFLRPNLIAIGLLSVFWHSIVAWTIFLISYVLGYFRIGLLFSILFLIQYSGMDMIMWRHISPYMFSLIFLGLGLAVLNNSNAPPTWKLFLICSGFNLASMLFHEFLAVALPLTGAILYSLKFVQPRKFLEADLNKYLMLCFLPAIIFFVLDLIDFYVNKVPFLGTADARDNLSHGILYNCIYLLGLFSVAYFFPFVMQFENLRHKVSWDFVALFPKQIYLILGVILLFSLFYILLSAIRKRNFNSNNFTVLLIITYLIVLIGSLVILRMNLRGIGYMKSASYYFYITNYLFFLLLIFNYQSLRDYFIKLSLIKYRKVILFFSSLGLFFLILMQIYLIKSTLVKSVLPEDWKMSHLVYFISRSTDSSTRFCYGGSTENLNNLFDERLLYRQSCNISNSGSALYLVTGIDGHYELTNFFDIRIKFTH
jgi:hypothetical protein